MQATVLTTAAANSALIASDNVATFFNAAPQAADTPTRKVSLFRNGANQAVRIPKEFELPGKDATMRREGNRLIIEAVQPKLIKGTAAALLAALESMKDWEPVLEEFPDVDEGLLPLDDINL
jgi:antitoxin VapB